MLISFCYAGLNYPNNGDELTYIHVLFDWDQEPDAVNYNLQISTQQSFSDIIIDIQEPTSLYIEKENLDWDNTYYWKVRPIDGNENFGAWSEVFNFSIGEKQFPIY